jgi:three-Cys-motif partner protein
VSKAHRFGGSWTTEKLTVLSKYLCAYNTALKDKPSKTRPFQRAYIDAFAGTGYRALRREEAAPNDWQGLLFPDFAGPEPQELLDGSARLALRTNPPFDYYLFIERKADRCEELEALKQAFPRLASRIEVRRGDANEEIQALSGKDWRSHRAVLFLDPYGMQVDWATIAAVAGTKAIDLWLLFPLGIGVNRLLTKSGEIPEGWRRRLDALLGTQDWYDRFYRMQPRTGLFGAEQDEVVKATTETIGRYFVDRLKTVFAGVVEQPGILRNSANNPLYLLCFAAGNETGAPIAVRIATDLLRDLK